MIKLGATTFWETFVQAPELISGDIPWATDGAVTPTRVPWSWSGITSLCHPWAAGPGYWMSQNLLGVKPTAPGFTRFEVAPQLAASLPTVAGVVPTSLGPFTVSGSLEAGQLNVTVPEGVEAGRIGIALLPGETIEALHHRVDGVLQAPVGGPPDAALDASTRWIAGCKAGRHAISWVVKGRRAAVFVDPPSPYAPPKYAATLIKADRTTGGDWRSKGGYGASGYHLFNWCGAPAGTECGTAREPGGVELACAAGGTITEVLFAEFGTPTGDCDSTLGPGSCGSKGLAALVAPVCKGHATCRVQCSFYANLGQHGCNVTAGQSPPVVVPLPSSICPPVPKTTAVRIACSNDAAGCVDSKLPGFVASITNGYGRGKLGTFAAAAAAIATDPRALEPPPGRTANRSIGKLAEGVIIAVDIAVANPRANPRANPGQPYRLSAYFVDFERQGRVISVSLFNSTGSTFDAIAPAQILDSFGDGVYLVWEVEGSVRLKVAHVGSDPGGQDALISALFFDPVSSSDPARFR